MAAHKQELHVAAILVASSARNREIVYRISYTSFLQRNNLLCLRVSETRTVMATMFLSNPGEMRKSYRGPSIDASCKLFLYLVKWFQRKRFLEIDQPKTRIAYVFGMFVNRSDRNDYLYREPSINASYQISVHLAKRFQRKRFLELARSCINYDLEFLHIAKKKPLYLRFIYTFSLYMDYIPSSQNIALC